MEIILIKWIDAETTGDTAWQNLGEVMTDATKAPPVMTTVGFLLHDCETHVAVVDTYGPEDCSMMHRIPREMIKSISKLHMQGEDPYAI
tara:strand:+ start:197 stop:463 length:267 start_codon:yes stop_codon:yes gene_type:complete